jgi:multisubunit Na+/H+ antiporter MnhB subunit
MSGALLVFDVLICAGLLGLAWRAVTAPELFHSVVLFMVFGLLMAVTMARLGSPDLALAEAAIGAGITGALLLNACRGVLADDATAGTLQESESHPWLPAPALFVICLALGGTLATLMVTALPPPPHTAEAVGTAAAVHPLGNPVTVVLLDFRGYDTLMEMVVLLLAFLGVCMLVAVQPLPDLNPMRAVQAPMLEPLLAVATPVLSMTALYLYYAGSSDPGGAFQAGALLAALGVLHRLTGRIVAADEAGLTMRLLLVIGLVAFSAVAWAALLWAPAPLSYPGQVAYVLILVVEFLLMISIAVALVLLFTTAPGIRRPTP